MASPATERRQLTIMFCDLVGSTEMSVRLDPEDLYDVIGPYQHACAAEVSRFGGFIAQYRGDGVLAYFGYPEAHEDDAERAVRSALALIEAVGRLSTTLSSCLKVRIGIATGLVVVGDRAGEPHAATGETPNLAARLQTVAEPNTVVISSSTRQRTRGLFVYRDLGPVHLQGFDASVPAWQVVGVSSAPSRFEALHETELIPLVGRENELARLVAQWQRAEAGDGRAVVLVGEPGIGKSRLVHELLGRLGATEHTRLRVFCSAHHRYTPLFPVIDHLERAAGLVSEDSVDRKLTKLETLLARVPTTREAIGLIAELLSLPADGRYGVPTLSPERHKERTLEALQAQVTELAAQRPVLLLFEDVQWIDPTSLELLTLIIKRVSRLRALVIVTARLDFILPWHDLAHLAVMPLTRLRRDEATALVDRVSRGKVLPSEILDQIVSRTDGVPLFVEELTKTVVESGFLQEEEERYTLRRPLPAGAIPVTLHDSLVARLARRRVVRTVAQIGAAIGREFSYPLVRAVASMPRNKLHEALAELVHAELVFAQGHPSEALYTFKHALVRDAAYDTLPRSWRRQLHARIAGVLEKRFPEVVERQPELLAQHCTEAGLTERAVAYWSQAGRRSFLSSAMIEAVSQFRKGLELLPELLDTPQRRQQELDLQTNVGAALIATQGMAAAPVEHAYARARELCKQMNDTSQLYPVLMGLTRYYSLRGDRHTVDELAEEIAALAQRQGDPSLNVSVLTALGNQLYAKGELVRARARFDEAIALYNPERQHRSHVLRIGYDEGLIAFLFQSHTLWYLGYPTKAVQAIRDALRLAQNLAHPLTEVHSAHFSAWLRVYRREAPQAQEQAEAQLALSEQQGFSFFVAHATAFLGWALVQQGKGVRGIELIKQGLERYRATGARAEEPYLLGLLTEAYGHIGQTELGLRAVEQALENLCQYGWPIFEAELFRLKGDLLLQRIGDLEGARPSAFDEAEECFGHALKVARHQQAKSLELRAAIGLGRLSQRRGNRNGAQDLLANVYGWFTEGFDEPDLLEARALLGELTT